MEQDGKQSHDNIAPDQEDELLVSIEKMSNGHQGSFNRY